MAYGKAFGSDQMQIAQWVIDAVKEPSRYRALVNLTAGVTIASAFTVIGAIQLGQPGLIAVGVLAGLFASVEAARVHDQSRTVEPGRCSLSYRSTDCVPSTLDIVVSDSR